MVRRSIEEGENVSQEWLDAVVSTARLPDGGRPAGLGAVRVGRQREKSSTDEPDDVHQPGRLRLLRVHERKIRSELPVRAAERVRRRVPEPAGGEARQKGSQ